jgi:hypothetical protein
MFSSRVKAYTVSAKHEYEIDQHSSLLLLGTSVEDKLY